MLTAIKALALAGMALRRFQRTPMSLAAIEECDAALAELERFGTETQAQKAARADIVDKLSRLIDLAEMQTWKVTAMQRAIRALARSVQTYFDMLDGVDGPPPEPMRGEEPDQDVEPAPRDADEPPPPRKEPPPASTPTADDRTETTPQENDDGAD